MNNFAINFLLGLICTLFLFVMSVIITLGIKTIGLMRFDLVKKQETNQQDKPKPNKKTNSYKKPRSKNTASVIKSIEIDPEQIDKIYVKKSS